jgi:hypothetical protein
MQTAGRYLPRTSKSQRAGANQHYVGEHGAKLDNVGEPDGSLTDNFKTEPSDRLMSINFKMREIIYS